MFLRHAAAIFFCTLLAGCDQLSALTTPIPEKVNAAFPLPDSLQVAHRSLQQSLIDNPAALQEAGEQFAKLMNVRALSCTATSPIGRLDTVSAIRRKVKDGDCFGKQDAELDQWVSLRRLALISAKPPLVPLAELSGKTPMPHMGDHSAVIAVATAANVIVARSGQRFNMLEIPSGRQLQSIPAPDLSYRPPLLSPNARVLVLPLGTRNLRLLEAETGNVLWNTEAYSGILAWMPQLKAALLTQSNTGSPYLLDLAQGRIDAFPSTEKQLNWAVPTPTASGKYLVGTGQTISLMDLARDTSDKLAAAPLKQWRVIAGRSINAQTVFLMDEGKRLVYQTGQDLGWLDLATENQGVWEVSGLNPQGFTKLNEQQILFDTHGNGSTPAMSRVLDISQEVISTVKDMEPREGALLALLPRSGFLRRGSSGVAIGTAVETESPRPLTTVLSEALLAKQLARLNPPGSGAENELTPYQQQLARQIRAMNTASAIRDGLSRDKVDAIRRGQSSAGTEAALPPGVKPMLTDISANARVSMVGVYESGRRSGTAKAGPVTIEVQPGATPLVLVLSSYEPVQWMVRTNGRKIEAVLLSGYNESNVYGAGDARVLKIGSRSAYKMDSREYELLKRDIARYVANPVSSFQGNYKGDSFRVN